MAALLAKLFAITAQCSACYLLAYATNKKYAKLIKFLYFFYLAEIGTELAIDFKDWLTEKLESLDLWVDDKTEAIKKPIETIEKPIEKAVEYKESVDKSVNDNIHKPAGEIRKEVSEHTKGTTDFIVDQYDNAKDYLNKINPWNKNK